jgi:hypothetical protein
MMLELTPEEAKYIKDLIVSDRYMMSRLSPEPEKAFPELYRISEVILKKLKEVV